MTRGRAPVTVAVVSYDTRELLERCLRSLVADERIDVWVVDNSSRDGSAELVRDCFPDVTLVTRGDNLGFGRAVNLVAARTYSPWLACANADTELTAGALDALLAAAAGDPRAGALAPRLVGADGRDQHSAYAFPGPLLSAAFALGAPRGGVADRLCLEGHWDPRRGRRVPWSIGAFLLLRRTAWEQAGGFDPRQWLYAEDLDLGWRLRQAGWATGTSPMRSCCTPARPPRHSGGVRRATSAGRRRRMSGWRGAAVRRVRARRPRSTSPPPAAAGRRWLYGTAWRPIPTSPGAAIAGARGYRCTVPLQQKR